MAYYVPNPPPFLTGPLTGGVVGALKAAAPDMSAVAAAYSEFYGGERQFTTYMKVVPGPGLPNAEVEVGVIGDGVGYAEYGSEHKAGTHAAQRAAEEAGAS